MSGLAILRACEFSDNAMNAYETQRIYSVAIPKSMYLKWHTRHTGFTIPTPHRQIISDMPSWCYHY